MEYPSVGNILGDSKRVRTEQVETSDPGSLKCGLALGVWDQLSRIEKTLATHVRAKATALALADGRETIRETDVDRAWDKIVVYKDRDISISGLAGSERELKEYLNANSRVASLVQRLEEMVLERACEIAARSGRDLALFGDCEQAWDDITFTRDQPNTELLAANLLRRES